MARQGTVRIGMLSIVMFLGLSASWRSLGQAPRRPENRTARPASPEIQSDHRVTFRIRAPKASAVTVGGD